MKRFISTGVTKVKTNLSDPTKSSAVVLYHWPPGYFLRETVKLKDGASGQRSRFIPTSTFTAAVSILTQRYGLNELINHKRDLSPGHVAVSAQSSYLSVGPDIATEQFQDVSLTSQHKLRFSTELMDDILGLERIPTCVDFHSLNVQQIERFIKEFILKKPSLLYSMVGERLALSEGESCTTAAYRCLAEGGLSELLSYYPYRILSEKALITPNALKEYCEFAKVCEHECYPDAKKLSEEFQAIFKSDMKKAKDKLQKFVDFSDPYDSSNNLPPKP